MRVVRRKERNAKTNHASAVRSSTEGTVEDNKYAEKEDG